MTEQAIERAHSPLGPSSFERAETCPASAVIALTAMPQPSSVYALEGTAAHVIFERCMVEGAAPWEFLDTGVEVEGAMFQVTPEMVEALTLAIDAARVRLEGRPYDAEVRLHLPGTPMFGTADLLAGTALPVLVLDLKYGQGIAVQADAVQLGCYALMGLIRDFGGGVLDGNPDEILAIATVLQPRGGGATAADHNWTRVSLAALAARVRRAGERLDARDMTYKVSAACRWCAAVTSCPALRLMADDAALSVVVTNTAVPVSADMLDDAVLLLAPLDLFAKRVAEAAQLYLEHGGVLANAKLVAKRATRDWADIDTAVAWLDNHGIEPFEIPKLKSPAQVEKGLPSALKPSLIPLVKKESSGLTMALSSDPRPEVKMTVERGQAALAQQQARAILARAKPRPEETKT